MNLCGVPVNAYDPLRLCGYSQYFIRVLSVWPYARPRPWFLFSFYKFVNILFKYFLNFTLREMSCVVVLKLYDTDRYFSKIRTYREVPRSRHVTCTLGGRIRICSDSDFFRGMENQISGHLIDTQRTKVMIFIYSPRFAENTDVQHTRHVVRLTHLTHLTDMIPYWTEFARLVTL